MRLTDMIQRDKPIVVVEFKPDDPNLIEMVKQVKPYVDAVRLTALKNSGDPLEKRTAEQLCFESAIDVKRVCQMDVLTSIVCRDHPKDDGALLRTLNESGVDNLLVLYGDRNDPPYPNYYHFQSSAELIQWVRKQESSFANQERVFSIAVGSDPTAKDVDKQISSLKEKKQAGADLTITQPIFEPQQGIQFLDSLQAADEKFPVLIGLLVAKSEKSMEFLERRLGVTIPPKIKERMKGRDIGEGLAIVRDVFRTLWNQADGYYVYPWADREMSTTIALLKELKSQ